MFEAGLLGVALTALFCVVALIAMACEAGFVTLLAFAVYGAALYFFAGVDWIAWGREHWQGLLWATLAYLPCGAAWSVCKWTLFVRKRARKFADFVREYRNRNDGRAPTIASVPYGLRTSIPKVADHRPDVVRWIAWWPFSLIETAISDFVREAVVFVYERLSGMLQAIADRVWKRATAGFEISDR